MPLNRGEWETTKGLKYRNPVAAVVQAFADLRLAAALAAKVSDDSVTLSSIADGLLARGAVSKDVADMCRDLEQVRNHVVHGSATPSVADAERFQDYAYATIRALRRVTGSEIGTAA